jgi:hypothetical protein
VQMRLCARTDWVLCDQNQVFGIRNEKVGVKLVMCSTDANTGDPKKAPKNLTDRGPAACRLIRLNERQMSLGLVTEERKFELWYFCLHLSDQHIAAVPTQYRSVIGTNGLTRSTLTHKLACSSCQPGAGVIHIPHTNGPNSCLATLAVVPVVVGIRAGRLRGAAFSTDANHGGKTP